MPTWTPRPGPPVCADGLLMTYVSGPVRVSVPATSANLGPGFDSLGLALDLRDVVTASVSDRLRITVDGADAVPLDERHLVHRAFVRGCRALGVAVPPVDLHCHNVIPHSRGLGSSSAAIVAGLALARAIVQDGAERLDDDGLFQLAADLEGHPDNVAPAVFGGFTISWADEGGFRSFVAVEEPSITAVVFVPGDGVATTTARGLLPGAVPHAEAAANAGRAALLVAALRDRPDLLLEATRDWLHQEYRRPAMPATLELVDLLRGAGHAAVVSGAGPTVLVLTDEQSAAQVATYAPAGWQALLPALDTEGLTLL